MKRWNRVAKNIRCVEPSTALEQDTGALRCLVCNRTLPNGVPRTLCVEHSPYPQQLIRELWKRRRARRRRHPVRGAPLPPSGAPRAGYPPKTHFSA